MRATLIAIAIVGASGLARADDLARAEQLFAEAIQLRDSSPDQACARFEQSLAYNRQAIGTLLNVALCHEQHGRIASAVELFTEARDRAREENRPDELAESERRIAALSADLPRLSLDFDGPPTPGTKILVDNQLVALEATSGLAVDPGERVIVVTAPGRVAFETRIILRKGEHPHIAIPRLGNAVVSSRRGIGLIVAAGGGGALVTGVVLGLIANSRYQRPFDDGHCTDAGCDQIGQPATESARTLGTVGTVVGAIGVAAIGAGIYLWLRSPGERPKKVTVVPHASGLAVVGQF